MKSFVTIILLYPMILFGQSISNIKLANKLFKNGDLQESKLYYKKCIENDPDNFIANTYLGYIALLSNDFTKAENYLLKASQIKPKKSSINWMLAEMYYRENKYKKASLYFSKTKRIPMVEKLNSFRNIIPYKIESNNTRTTIKFITTDPLPVIQVKLSNGEIINLFIDTGGGELILDLKYLDKLNLINYGTETGTFAGGKKGKIYHSRLDSISIGEFSIKNLPILLMKISKPVQEYFGDIQIDGVLGTNLLYQFLSAIDYKNGQLILQRKKTVIPIQEEKSKFSLPIFLAPDHFILGKGTINDCDSTLLFIDTGLIGGAFTCPKSTLKKANIKLDKSKKMTGTGGGGTTIELPFQIDSLSLGSFKQKDLKGIYLGKFPWENIFGFRIGGLISHDFFKDKIVTFDFINMKCYIN